MAAGISIGYFLFISPAVAHDYNDLVYKSSDGSEGRHDSGYIFSPSTFFMYSYIAMYINIMYIIYYIRYEVKSTA